MPPATARPPACHPPPVQTATDAARHRSPLPPVQMPPACHQCQMPPPARPATRRPATRHQCQMPPPARQPLTTRRPATTATNAARQPAGLPPPAGPPSRCRHQCCPSTAHHPPAVQTPPPTRSDGAIAVIYPSRRHRSPMPPLGWRNCRARGWVARRSRLYSKYRIMLVICVQLWAGNKKSRSLGDCGTAGDGLVLGRHRCSFDRLLGHVE